MVSRIQARPRLTMLDRAAHARSHPLVSTESPIDFQVTPADKSNMARYPFSFSEFKHCLYPVQKFQSDAERRLAVILDRDTSKWFKPAKGQFQIFYKWGADHPEYQPDFVAEATDAIYMLVAKAKNEMTDPVPSATLRFDGAIRQANTQRTIVVSRGGEHDACTTD